MTSSLRERWSKYDWLVLLGLAGLAVLAWSKVLFSRQWSFGVEVDFLRQFYPARVYAADMLSQGTFPLWSPYVLAGQPYFASFQTAMLYPPNLGVLGLYAAFGLSWGLKVQCAFVVFHLWLAGIFTYLLARDLEVGRAGSAVAAVTFMFAGFMTAHAGHINQVSSAAWMPLVFLLFNRALSRKKLGYAVGAGVAMAVALLAGHLQSVFYLCCLLLGLVVFKAVQHHRSDPHTCGLFMGLGLLAVTVALAAGLAAAQLVPTYELIGMSTRSHIPYAIAQGGSLPRWQTVNLLFPHFFGSSPESYFGGWAMWETYGYFGIVALALGVVAWLRRRKGWVIFFWAVLVLAIILAWGPDGGLFTLLYNARLFFNRFHDPARILVVVGFAGAMLAGFGADHLTSVVDEPEKVRFRSAIHVVIAVAVTVLLAAAALSVVMLARGSNRRPEALIAMKGMIFPLVLLAGLLGVLLLARFSDAGKQWLGAGLVALVIIDIVLMNMPWVMVQVNPDDLYGDRGASGYVASRPGVFRVETDAHTMYDSLDNGALYGLEKSCGDDSLVIGDYDRFREIIVPQVNPGVQPSLMYEGAVLSPMIDVMNDTYFMMRQPMPPVLAEGKYDYLGYYGTVNVYRNRTALPRAWMSDAIAFRDNEQVYEELVRTRGDGIRETAYVVYPEGIPPGEQSSFIPAVKGPVTASWRGPHRLVLDVDPGAKGLLVVSEVYYPGWEVYVDGLSKEILKTDLAFRGVMLEGGQSKVEFVFRPRSLRMGIVVSLAAAGAVVLYLLVRLALWFFRRRRAGASVEAVGPDAGPQ
ncbi:MAG: DUF6541 family protein [Actinomycetota bacterium]